MRKRKQLKKGYKYQGRNAENKQPENLYEESRYGVKKMASIRDDQNITIKKKKANVKRRKNSVIKERGETNTKTYNANKCGNKKRHVGKQKRKKRNRRKKLVATVQNNVR